MLEQRRTGLLQHLGQYWLQNILFTLKDRGGDGAAELAMPSPYLFRPGKSSPEVHTQQSTAIEERVRMSRMAGETIATGKEVAFVVMR